MFFRHFLFFFDVSFLNNTNSYEMHLIRSFTFWTKVRHRKKIFRSATPWKFIFFSVNMYVGLILARNLSSVNYRSGNRFFFILCARQTVLCLSRLNFDVRHDVCRHSIWGYFRRRKEEYDDSIYPPPFLSSPFRYHTRVDRSIDR